MLRENLSEFFGDLWYLTKKGLKSRVAPFVIITIVLFAALIYRIFVLQIVNGSTYTTNYAMKAERTVTTTGTRGNIYDSNGVLLAYSELAYSVIIEDAGYYSSTKVKNETLNEIISNSVDIIESHGDSVDYNFSIILSDSGEYEYTISDNTLLRFLRDIYGHSYISELTDTERNATARETVEYLMKRYRINQPATEDSTEEPITYDDAKVLKIIYFRYSLAANSYQRYIPVTVASDVSAETMAAILENTDKLTGVTISEDYVRKYNYSTYIAHIIGYTGKINETELEELRAIDESYSSTDIVGKAGIEAEYETTLAGTKGSTTMLLDSVGRVQEIKAQTEAVVGDDVYLTIDVELQQQIYELLERRLAETLVTRMVSTDATLQDDNIVIPITEVTFALINNNLIDMEQIATSDTPAATATYASFSGLKESVLAELTNELNTGTAYNALSENMQEYVTLIRRNLIDSSIINSELISSSDELSQNWTAGTISLREYISGAISNGWINIYNLDVSSEYPTSDEVINSIITEALSELEDDKDFSKLLYERLIYNHTVSGRNICLILMEQDAIEYTESEYVTINNGGSVFNFLYNKILNLQITPAQLALDPCSGSCVVEDPNTGNLLAMVTYPSYDINYFSGSIDSTYYAALLDDKSTPLVNRATQTRIAPGSTFKPLVSVAALAEGVVSPTELVECTGIYTKVSPSIKCAVYPNEHGPLNLNEAIEHSCNSYFNEMGYRLSVTSEGTLDFSYGLARLKKYTDLFGLSTKSGIQLPEATPRASDFNPVASAIGQGTNAYTSLNLARYVSTLSNKGTVYNTSIVLKVVDGQTDEETFTGSVVANTVDVADSIWDNVHGGMQDVIDYGVMAPLASRLPVTVYGKSGTAEESSIRANHACYILFSKDSEGNADLVTTVMLPNAYAATNAGIMTYYAMSAYYGIDIPSHVYFDINTALIINE